MQSNGSPKAQRIGSPSSPKRSVLLSSRQSAQNNAHWLQSIRNKLPLISRALSFEGLTNPSGVDLSSHDSIESDSLVLASTVLSDMDMLLAMELDNPNRRSATFWDLMVTGSIQLSSSHLL